MENIRKHLLKENKDLKSRIIELEDTIAAIQNGEIDAIVNINSDNSIELLSLPSTEKAYRSFIEQLNEGAAILTEMGLITYSNKKLHSMLNAKDESMEGNFIFEYFKSEQREKIKKILNNGSKKYVEEEFTFVLNKTKTPSYIRISVLPLEETFQIQTDISKSNQLCLIATDVTTYKKMEQSLIKYQNNLESLVDERTKDLETVNLELKDERNKAQLYVDLLSHDISNRSQPIMTYLEMVLMSEDFPSKYKGLIEKAHNQVLDIAKLIENINFLSQLKYIPCDIFREDLFFLLKKTQKCVKKAHLSESITFNSSLKPGRISVISIPYLQNAFEIILNNAIKYNKQETTIIDINVSESKHKNYWKVEIKDNGPGIPDDMKEQIFHREGRENSKVWTSGIGLTVANAILTKCNGDIWVEDKIKGDYTQGSNFVVLLPKASKNY